MDPLTHTLFGAVLAETGLKRRSALALPTLLIGANLPDIDVVAYLHGPDAGLHLRRGWTHGVFGLALLPVALTLLMIFVDGWRRRRGHDGPPVVPVQLLLLSYISVLSHPFLDWLNTYGVRVLMPFSGRWFYGDALFVVDPWGWLLLGAAIFWNHSRTPRELSRWAALALVATVFLFLNAGSHPWAPRLWTVILMVLVVGRWLSGPPSQEGSRRRARLALGAAALYVGGMIGLTAQAQDAVRAELSRSGIEATGELMAGPDRFDSLVRLVVVPTKAGYRVGRYHPLDAVGVQLEERIIPFISPTPSTDVVNAARASSCVHGMVEWVRFPFYEIDATTGGYDVYILDARYVQRRTRGFGGATVRVGSDLKPVECLGGVSRKVKSP